MFLLWNAWQQEHPSQATLTEATKISGAPVLSNELPSESDVPPGTLQTEGSLAENLNVAEGVQKEEISEARSRVIFVRTDLYDVQIDTQGGSIISASLRKFPEKVNQPEPQVLLLKHTLDQIYVAQSGLLGNRGPDGLRGQGRFEAKQKIYEMGESDKNLDVALTWEGSGLKVQKIFHFSRDNYQISVEYVVENSAQAPWIGQMYGQIKRSEFNEKSNGLTGLKTFTGAAYSSPEEPYKKLSFKEMRDSNLSKEVRGGWVAMIERYFLTAWIPHQEENFHYYTKHSRSGEYTIGMIGQKFVVPPRKIGKIKATLYLGPSETERLAAAAPHLDLAIDFGMFWFISSALFWLLKKIHLVLGNWGWSIVLVTIIIKLLFYRLSESSYRSMANMRKLAPKMQALKEKYGEDRQKLSQATMELYKKEK